MPVNSSFSDSIENFNKLMTRERVKLPTGYLKLKGRLLVVWHPMFLWHSFPNSLLREMVFWALQNRSSSKGDTVDINGLHFLLTWWVRVRVYTQMTEDMKFEDFPRGLGNMSREIVSPVDLTFPCLFQPQHDMHTYNNRCTILVLRRIH